MSHCEMNRQTSRKKRGKKRDELYSATSSTQTPNKQRVCVSQTGANTIPVYLLFFQPNSLLYS